MEKGRKERIETLLERYFEARTTAVEEAELHRLLREAEPDGTIPAEVRLMFDGMEALASEQMAVAEFRPAPLRQTLWRRMSPWWGVAAAAVVAVGFFLCVEWFRQPYCYIDGRPVYDREVAMQATAYFDAFSALGTPERIVDDLMENL